MKLKVSHRETNSSKRLKLSETAIDRILLTT